MELKDKVVLVTGGSQGIGFSIARRMIEEGAKVLITGRRREMLAMAAEQLGAHPIQMDVSNTEDVDRAFRELESIHSGLDVLVNNAGIGGQFKTLLDLEPDDFQQVFATNVVGATMMAQRAARIFLRQNRGNIVNIGSTASLKGFSNGSAYAGSKFALRGLSQCWQAELRKFNVRVFHVNPSEVVTAFANNGVDKQEVPNKLRGDEIASAVAGALKMDDRGFIPELSVWATNPW